MPIHSYTGGHVFTNGYIIQHQEACIAIDAPALLHEVLDQEDLKPTHLLLTHQHFDHTEDVEALQERGVQVWMHSDYAESLIRQKEARANWGLPVNIRPFTADRLLAGCDAIEINGLSIFISHIPGHSPDSIAFYCPALGAVFSGDTLMADSIGRTDLPGGSHQLLLQGIREKLFTLPDDTLVLSGHGPQTTIGHEKEHNPFI